MTGALSRDAAAADSHAMVGEARGMTLRLSRRWRDRRGGVHGGGDLCSRP